MEAGCHVAVGDYVTTDTIVDEQALTSWGATKQGGGQQTEGWPTGLLGGHQQFDADTRSSQ
jgi:hypothetical protein